MNEMAAEGNSTTFFPLPIDLLRVFMDGPGKSAITSDKDQ
jgi:hypothetical protein